MTNIARKSIHESDWIHSPVWVFLILNTTWMATPQCKVHMPACGWEILQATLQACMHWKPNLNQALDQSNK